MIKFCGSPTMVQTPPNAVPIEACINKLRKKPEILQFLTIDRANLVIIVYIMLAAGVFP